MYGLDISERIPALAPPCREPGARPLMVGPSPAGLRTLEHRDIPEVCDLFGRTFRTGQAVRRAALEGAVEQTYMTSPEDAQRPASLVDIDADGRVVGFLGVITLKARLGSRVLRGGLLGSFMAREAHRARSGPRLLRAAMASSLDFVFSDTANRTSLDLSSALRFEVLPLQSLSWFKLLRPCATATLMAGRAYPVLGTALGPLARLADMGAKRFTAVPLPPDASATVDRAIGLDDFVARAPALVERFRLAPAWSQDELAWLCAQASCKTRNGALETREVVDRAGRLLGLYLLYAAPGAVAQALQILAIRNRETEVVGAVLRRAEVRGAVAVRGHADPSVVKGLLRCPGVLYRHLAASVAFTRDAELRQAFGSADACVGGLFGESWTRLMADDFA